jgi:hypothetical protein
MPAQSQKGCDLPASPDHRQVRGVRAGERVRNPTSFGAISIARLITFDLGTARRYSVRPSHLAAV